MISRGRVVIAGVITLIACASRSAYRDLATTTATQHLTCGSGDLRVEAVKRWAFHATGCGKEGWYRCHQAGAKLCCEPVASQSEATAVFAPHDHGGHFTGDGQVCDAAQ